MRVFFSIGHEHPAVGVDVPVGADRDALTLQDLRKSAPVDDVIRDTIQLRLRCWGIQPLGQLESESDGYTWLDLVDEGAFLPLHIVGGNMADEAEGTDFIHVQILCLEHILSEEEKFSELRAESWDAETTRLRELSAAYKARPTLPRTPVQPQRRASTTAAQVAKTAKQGVGKLISMFRGGTS